MNDLKKLLVLDDEPAITDSVALLAEMFGFDVRTLNRSVDAASVFADYRPDVVVLDIRMPGKDGIAVLKEILQTRIPTRIILTSGGDDAGGRLAAEVAPSFDTSSVMVLMKPYDVNDLIAALSA